MSKKLETMAAEIGRLKEKRQKIDAQLKELEEKYRETENAEIHDLVHAANLTPEQLAEVLKLIRKDMPAAEKTMELMIDGEDSRII